MKQDHQHFLPQNICEKNKVKKKDLENTVELKKETDCPVASNSMQKQAPVWARMVLFLCISGNSITSIFPLPVVKYKYFPVGSQVISLTYVFQPCKKNWICGQSKKRLPPQI